MSHVKMKNIVVTEEAQTLGICGGALLGAVAGAKVAPFWNLPAYTACVVAGAIVGALGGKATGNIIAVAIDK
ncbi:MAG: hypothetical protein LBV79_03005 [Candidatus Adiutrix sp.]|nr:hypothetical protein [Candidatus Adiutrix sp.]